MVLAPRQASSHKEMVSLVGRRREDVSSAGFLGARYAPGERWEPYGRSTGLDIGADPRLTVPDTLYAGKHRYGVVFATCSSMLESVADVAPAVWGMTAESPWGDVLPVYAPLHPRHMLRANEVLTD